MPDFLSVTFKSSDDSDLCSNVPKFASMQIANEGLQYTVKKMWSTQGHGSTLCIPQAASLYNQPSSRWALFRGGTPKVLGVARKAFGVFVFFGILASEHKSLHRCLIYQSTLFSGKLFREMCPTPAPA